MTLRKNHILYLLWLALTALILSACQVQLSENKAETLSPPVNSAITLATPVITSTDLPQRPTYAPGELVDYIAQTGDTLPALAVRFNTTVAEIRMANTFIPDSATTMPPGMPMKIPIYYAPFWGSQYQILPDSLFINGPSQLGFSTSKFISEHPGWLKSYKEYASGANRSAAEIIDLVSLKFSISPRLLLALIEHQSGALSQEQPTDDAATYPVGYTVRSRQGLYRQLLWAANLLNDGYYRSRMATQTTFEHEDGRIERFDPWQNAATVSLQIFFNTLLSKDSYLNAIGPDGFALTYQKLFGDPWSIDEPHIPGSLEQPAFWLPFEVGKVWAFTGGPHTAWGTGQPWAALDFAPPLITSGCQETDQWVTAVADGLVVRSETGEVVLDVDQDGDERTGWVVFYLHVGTKDRAKKGSLLKAGEHIGHPSCEGGSSTGTHVHIARKYNGEWIPAQGVLAFNLEGWSAQEGPIAYKGTLSRLSRTVTACECSNQASFIESDRH